MMGWIGILPIRHDMAPSFRSPDRNVAPSTTFPAISSLQVILERSRRVGLESHSG
jgi:hypothetical protein